MLPDRHDDKLQLLGADVAEDGVTALAVVEGADGCP
jgi:hypothetical protein